MPNSLICREEALRKSASKCSLKAEERDSVQCSTGKITLHFGSNLDPSHEISEMLMTMLSVPINKWARNVEHSSQSADNFWEDVTEFSTCFITNHFTNTFNLYSLGTGAMPIQGDSGGKVNILGGVSIGHCEKKNVHMNMCLTLNVYRDLLESTNTKVL
jgi:hypothetical protein